MVGGPGVTEVKGTDWKPHSFSEVKVKCLPPGPGGLWAEKSTAGWTLVHSKVLGWGKWFWATKLLEGTLVAQPGGGGQNLPLGPLFSLFFPPPSLNLSLLPSCLFAQEQDGCNIPPHPRVGAGGSGKDAQKLLPRQSASRPHGPAGGLLAVSTSRECGCESRLMDVWKMKKFKTSPPCFRGEH